MILCGDTPGKCTPYPGPAGLQSYQAEMLTTLEKGLSRAGNLGYRREVICVDGLRSHDLPWEEAEKAASAVLRLHMLMSTLYRAHNEIVINTSPTQHQDRKSRVLRGLRGEGLRGEDRTRRTRESSTEGEGDVQGSLQFAQQAERNTLLERGQLIAALGPSTPSREKKWLEASHLEDQEQWQSSMSSSKPGEKRPPLSHGGTPTTAGDDFSSSGGEEDYADGNVSVLSFAEQQPAVLKELKVGRHWGERKVMETIYMH